MDDGDNVTRLPIGFKHPPQEDGRILKVANRWETRDRCTHDKIWREGGGGLSGRFVDVTYVLREGETEVECGNCATKLDPMWVLKRLAERETDYERKRAIAQDEMKRLSERQKTQCDHCGKMTRISRAKARPR